MSSASSSTNYDYDDYDYDDDDDDDGAAYDNSKRPRSGLVFGNSSSYSPSPSPPSSSLSSSFLTLREQIRYPGEVLTSMHRDVNPMMVRDFVFALICFQFGMRGPTMFVLPLMMGGGMTLRPIPFQVTMAGDVLLDLTLSNVYVSKSDVTFPCESLYII